jgi:hypothetical protein
MDRFEMLGLAVVTITVAVAAIGAGTASAAGRLCSTASNPCTSPWPTPTAFAFSLKSGSSVKWTDTSGNTIDTCTQSTISGNLEGNASGGTASGNITQLTFSGCTVTTDTILPGGLRFESVGSGAGKVSSTAKTEVTTNVYNSCNWGVEAGTSLGTLSEGTAMSAVFAVNAVVRKLNGGFLCPETTKLVAEYVLTSPSNTTLYVSPS